MSIQSLAFFYLSSDVLGHQEHRAFWIYLGLLENTEKGKGEGEEWGRNGGGPEDTEIGDRRAERP